MDCQVVIISFGIRQGALRWKSDTSCPFPLYLDQERLLYSRFGMKRSVAKVWSRNVIGTYVKAKLEEISIPNPYADIKDDPLQMAGDIIFKNNEPVLIHLSKTSADRPNIESVLELMMSKSQIE